jgi:hypothetical protein
MNDLTPIELIERCAFALGILIVVIVLLAGSP